MPWYYINDAGTQPEGPFQFSELATKFQQGAIDVDTFVWHGKRVKEWTKISEVGGLAEKLRRHKLKTETPRSSRGSVADMSFPERRSNSHRSRQTPNFAKKESLSEDALGQGPGHKSSLEEFKDSLRNAKSDDLIRQLWESKKSNVDNLTANIVTDAASIAGSRHDRMKSTDNNKSAVSDRMVQIANLLVKTQDELERQKQENEIILKENRDQKGKMAELESKLKKEMLSKQTLRKQWKKAQTEYESEIKQYQSQLDIFFAAETELNEFSDDKSIQINLSFVE